MSSSKKKKKNSVKLILFSANFNDVFLQIPNLMRAVPELFTMELILQLYCLDSAAKTAVRDLCLLRNLTMKQ